ncbi:complement C1q-like protein 3 [Mytilus galloprovincialis]|uniref:complement C1q-like protein 3 n=1 Tax=Mytilus galloprovincialis TaxID=29158 RepID=UPI003F7C828F
MFRTTVTVFLFLMMMVKVESACDTELQNGLFQDLLNMMMKIKGSNQELSTCKCQKKVPAIAFTASLTATKSIGPLETIKFNKVWTNAGTGYDPNSGIFTAAKKGYYQITATIMSQSGKWFHASIWKNDQQTVALYPGKGHHTGSASIVLNLKKGDRVFIKHHNYTQDFYSDVNQYSMFSGFLISE